MTWQLPSEEEIAKEDALKPKKIEDLSEGGFVGVIEEVETFTDNSGKEKQDAIGLAIRIVETSDGKYLGELMRKYVNVFTKKGQVNRQGYAFLKALVPAVGLGNPWHPNELTSVRFAAQVIYNKQYWDFIDTEYLGKEEGFDL